MFTITTHPVLPGLWIVVDDRGRTWGEPGSLFGCIAQRSALVARFGG